MCAQLAFYNQVCQRPAPQDSIPYGENRVSNDSLYCLPRVSYQCITFEVKCNKSLWCRGAAN